METFAQMQARMSALYKELKDLHGLESRSAEQESRLDAILAEMNDLGPKMERQRAIESRLAEAKRDEQPAGSVAARDHAVDGAEERSKLDLRSPMVRFLDSDAYAAYRKNPRGKSEALAIGSFHKRLRRAVRLDGEARDAMDTRGLIYSAGVEAGAAAILEPEVLPTIYRGREAPLMMRDVLLNAETTSNAITVLRENVFTNAAAEVPEATATSSTGYTDAAKPESSLTFTQETFDVATIAHWIPITRAVLDDVSFLRTYVEARLIIGLKRRENDEILNGDGTGANITGLYETANIQVADDAYFTGAPVQNAGTDLENFERVLRAKTLVSTVGEAQATFVVLNPSDYEVFQTLANANNNYYGGGPFAAGGVPTLWGLPVVVDENNDAGRALVGDGTMAAVVDRMDAQIFVSDSHSDFFTHNMLAFLAEERMALPVFRPAAFVDVELV